MKTAQNWIDTLKLAPHPEGGFYRETYRSATSTAIYFLLREGEISAFHRIVSDELWHLYAASPQTRLRVWRITPEGRLTSFALGSEPTRGEVFQDVVPGGDWFAGEVEVVEGASGEAYALVGCTVSPGFQFSQFELADGEALARRWPEHAALARRLSVQSS